MRRYDSFVVRCWHLDGGRERIEVEHLQSGGHTRLDHLAALTAWICTQCDESVAPTTEPAPRGGDASNP
jgi:hypothetical protein